MMKTESINAGSGVTIARAVRARHVDWARSLIRDQKKKKLDEQNVFLKIFKFQ